MLPKKGLLGYERHAHHFLLESEKNYSCKCIKREEIRAAIEHGQIYQEQYIRPHRSAVAHRVNRRLVFDYQ